MRAGGEAGRVAREIAEALRDVQPPSADLATGSAGLAIAFDCFDHAWPGEGFDERAEALLADAVRALAHERLDASLYHGITGIAWAVARLRERADERRLRSLTEQVDRLLLSYVSASPWRGYYDLISGLTGIGVYALARLDAPAGPALLEAIVERLAESAIKQPPGRTWHTRPGLLPEWQRQRCPGGYFNLGMAHGVPGPVALLGAACAQGVGEDPARRLLEAAVSWLLAQDDGDAYGPWIAAEDHSPSRVRSVWCYGDPGVASALLLAARGARRADWEDCALAIARRAARRDADTARVRDTPLCHGAAGLAHMFGRLHAATGDAAMDAAATAWLQRTLTMRDPGHGVAGFPYMAPNDADVWIPTVEAGLLEGAAGVALTLLSAGAPGEATWDRFMLLSAPGAPAARYLG